MYEIEDKGIMHGIRPHLAALRKSLMIMSGTIFVMFFVCFAFYEPILNWMIIPVEAVLPKGSEMVAIEVQETFFTAIKVAFFSAFIVSLPVILWQVWDFIGEALHDHEKKFVIPFIFSALAMFSIGASFAYYIVVPFGFDFLINFGSQVVTVMPSIGKYVTFFTKLLFGFGIAFELPVFTFLFAFAGIINDQDLKDFFKYAVVIIFMLSALLTPPDVITQFLMAVPMILLYGVSVQIAKIFNPASKYEEEEEIEDLKD